MVKTWAEFTPEPGRPFLKMQGLENHFVIVDGRETGYFPSPDEAAHICNPRTGIGADQLLIIQPPTERGAKAGAYAFMRIINIDGQDAEACGNATRCFAWLMLEETGLDAIVLETVVGPLRCQRKGHKIVSVEMGRITTQWDRIPLQHATDTVHLDISAGPLFDGIALNIGNPHVVYFVDDLDSVNLESVAPSIQNNPIFPNKVNVGAAQVVRDDYIRSGVYERPGLLTRACGSGACVAVRAAQLRGLTSQNRVTVEMPAGLVDVEIKSDNSAVLTGPVEYCFSGTLPGPERNSA
ncbi:diaminopimelate epimerase [Pseudorhodobacter sp.]|uniref:diaminopimelate epimerase n=1 Tax=Pseudorhodobacter sp. TaxID=1934400 RepID=UPI002AFE13CA|nr:diaminopimelate epimerase [Pseudorhodobacter sp.]